MRMNAFWGFLFGSDLSSTNLQVIGNLTVENRVDWISLYGDLDITRDKDGLGLAQELKTMVNVIISTLEGEHLPDKLPTPVIKKVKNPF
ncbi:MAG: hypothetical protein JWQ21_2956 [Herminiimonas sp.]|nr:hypothetical protein [Herminiimonas sp.]